MVSLGRWFHDIAYCFLYQWCQVCNAFVPSLFSTETTPCLEKNLEELDKRILNRDWFYYKTKGQSSVDWPKMNIKCKGSPLLWS